MNINKNTIERIYKESELLTKEKITSTLKTVLETIDMNITKFGNKFPDAASNDLEYSLTDNHGWTTSFWTGMLWLAYYYTKDDKYKEAAEKHIESFRKRYEDRYDFETHDLGFLYSLSCVSAYKLTNDEAAKDLAIKAADELIGRFKEKGQFIQAWGDKNDRTAYRLIIDCMMNLPLLYWASEVTGDSKYYNAAYAHAKTTMDVIIRDDYSTYHTFYFDPDTGEKDKGITAQGYSDSSCWARGQAWSVYGTALSYRYTHDSSFMEHNEKLAEYFLNRLPEDLVPYWDLIFTDGNEERDSSSAAILACGLIESADYIEDSSIKELYINAARGMVNSLTDNYLSGKPEGRSGLIKHSVYSKPGNNGVDEFSIWGDYYYLEALLRCLDM